MFTPRQRFNPQAKQVEAKVRFLGKTLRGWEALYMALPGPPTWEASLAWGAGCPPTDQVGQDWSKGPLVRLCSLSPGQFLFLHQP